MVKPCFPVSYCRLVTYHASTQFRYLLFVLMVGLITSCVEVRRDADDQLVKQETIESHNDSLIKLETIEPDIDGIPVFGDTVREQWICDFPGGVESSFPGGSEGWSRFLEKHLVYPADAIDKEIQGRVVLKFKVCEDGKVCDVEAIRGPEILRQAALQAFAYTPDWEPALSKGIPVMSYKQQSILFKLDTSE